MIVSTTELSKSKHPAHTCTPYPPLPSAQTFPNDYIYGCHFPPTSCSTALTFFFTLLSLCPKCWDYEYALMEHRDSYKLGQLFSTCG